MITIADIEAAAARLAGYAVRTPLLESPLLNDRLGGRVLVKPELLQVTGSFKFRGAFNKLSQIPQGAWKNGVVAFSSGNHAQGVAAAARLLGMPATIVMPADAPAIKRRNTEAYGARVLLYDRIKDDREAIGARIAAETGAVLVPPYDDEQVIAGQGTVGLEIAMQCAELAVRPDAVLLPASGGGLIAGAALALTEKLPQTEVWVVEPEGYDDHARSLEAGERLSHQAPGPTLCDALMAPKPGAVTFPINRRLLAGGVAVDDNAVLRAMATAFDAFKLVAEPAGAIALAAILAGRLDARGRILVAVLSGGNVDPEIFAQALAVAG